MTRIPMPSPTGYNAENLFVSSALAHDAAGLDPRESRSGPEGGSFRNVDPDTGGWKRRRDDDALKDRSRRRRARDQGPDDDLADAVSEMQGHLNDNIADPGALTR